MNLTAASPLDMQKLRLLLDKALARCETVLCPWAWRGSGRAVNLIGNQERRITLERVLCLIENCSYKAQRENDGG